jgi:hypothetical protein
MPEIYENARRAILGVYGQMEQDAQNSMRTQESTWSQLWRGLPNTIMAALSGGGDVMGSVFGHIGQTLIGDGGSGVLGQALFGKMTKGVQNFLGEGLFKGVAEMIPGLGPIIGMGLNKLFGALKGAFNEGAIVNDMRDEFMEARGGLEGMHKAIAAFGNDPALMKAFEKMYFTGDKGTFEKASEAYEKRMGELAKLNEAVGEKVGLLGAELERFGGKAPAAMQPLIEGLLKAQGLSAEMREALAEMAGDTSWQALQDMAEEYGISLDGLGQKFQQLKLDELAVKYASDFQFLMDNGADLTAVLEGMKDEVQEMVNGALKFGTAIPENMKSLLQAMVGAGMLTDEFGNRLEDLSKFSFKERLEDPFDRIAKILEDIRQLLGGGIPDAAGKAGNAFRGAFNGEWNLPRQPKMFDPEGQLWMPGPDEELHGGFLSEQSARSGGLLNIVVEMDGRQVARAAAPWLPDELEHFRVGVE